MCEVSWFLGRVLSLEAGRQGIALWGDFCLLDRILYLQIGWCSSEREVGAWLLGGREVVLRLIFWRGGWLCCA